MPTKSKDQTRRKLLVPGLVLASLLLLVLLAAGGFALWLSQADLRPMAERRASAELGRRVTVGGLDIAWGALLRGDPLGIEIRDLRIANAPWGSDPEMARIGRFSARLDVGSLLQGVLRYERLRIVDLNLVLERDQDGTGNWKFGGPDDDRPDGGSSDSGGFALVPKSRTQFPTLIDFAGENGRITYRTRGGNLLRIDLDRVAIASPDELSPVTLQATGAYNDVALRLDATTEPYFILRDADVPFGTRFAIVGKDTDIAFDGTMMEPLDFDGVRGKLSLTARNLNDLLAIMGSQRKVELPLLASGDLVHDGDRWLLDAAAGRLDRAAYAGRMELLEGRAGAPDDIALRLDFGALGLDPILAALTGSGGGTDGLKLDAIPLRPSGLTGVNLSAVLSTERLSVGGFVLPSFALDGRLAGGEVTLRDLKFLFGGGTLAFDGSLKGEGETGDLHLNAHLIEAEAAELARMLGGGDEIRGRLNGSATLRLRGVNLGEALERSNGAALVTLAGGDIERSLLEKVSTDLRSLFRTEQGRVEIGCLLAAMTFEDGVGTLSPLRLESGAAVVLGGGTVDLADRRLDLTLKTARDSTSFFALDIPIRISGPFGDLSVESTADADQNWIEAAQQGVAPDGLPQGLREMAQRSTCIR